MHTLVRQLAGSADGLRGEEEDVWGRLRAFYAHALLAADRIQVGAYGGKRCRGVTSECEGLGNMAEPGEKLYSLQLRVLAPAQGDTSWCSAAFRGSAP